MSAQTDELRIGGKDAHEHLRNAQAGEKEHAADDHQQQERKALNLADDGHFPLAVILGGHHRRAGADPPVEQREDERDLPGEGGSAQRRLADGGEHEYVRGIDDGADEVLQDDGQHQRDQTAVHAAVDKMGFA